MIFMSFISLGMTDLRSVVAEPVVGLSEVIEDDAAAVTSAGRQDNRRGGVGFAGHPGRVEGVCNEEEGHDQNHPTGNLVGICNTGCHQGLFFSLWDHQYAFIVSTEINNGFRNISAMFLCQSITNPEFKILLTMYSQKSVHVKSSCSTEKKLL